MTSNHSAPYRVSFVHAPDPIADTANYYGVKFMPGWAYALAAHIPDDGRYLLSLTDCRFEKSCAIQEADVFLFSGINQDLDNLERVRKKLKELHPKGRSIIGGPITWSFEQAGTLKQLAGFDHIFIGDGEEEIGNILKNLSTGAHPPHVLHAKRRFPINEARPLHRPMLDSTISRYYGAVLEVSRGCPFLCEFCDIRVLPDNNRPHNKSSDLIISELDHLARLGVKQVLLACDNFIGDLRWAEEVIDKILEWQAHSGFRLSLYTWLTINLYKSERLMVKMRRVGFDMLFIGVESFSQNSLLETAKVQNAKTNMIESVRQIQSYGFIVVAGMIFGFDSDTDASFQEALDGLNDAALLSGDPSLLIALPGTPLYRRMKLSGRLREVGFSLRVYKYLTNIRYLLPATTIVGGYKHFVKVYCNGQYQYQRLKNFFSLIDEGNFIPMESKGYSNLGLFLKMVVTDRAAIWQMIRRVVRFGSEPSNIIWALRGFKLAFANRRKGGLGYFQFWFFAWTTAIMKYRYISDTEFDVESIPQGYDIKNILPAGYQGVTNEPIPLQKIEAQQRTTIAQLEQIVAARQ